MVALLPHRVALGLVCLLSVSASAASAASAPVQRESPFMTEFRKLMQVKATDEMAALIKKNEPAALSAIRETVLLIREGSNETLEVEIDALGRAWKKAYDSDFVILQYDYFALRLTGPFKRSHKELSDRWLAKQKEFDGALTAKEAGKYGQLAAEFEGFGEAFTELGDHYQASMCHWNSAVLYDDGINGTRADYRRACKAWGLAIAARDEAKLHDKAYDQAVERHKKLIADGYGGPPEDGPDAGAPAPEATPAGAPGTPAEPAAMAAPLGATFAIVPDIEAIQRPMYTADSNFQMWQAVYLGEIGTSGSFPTMTNSPMVLRTGANKASVDVNADGAGDVDIPLTGKITPVQVTIEGRSWGFLAAIGQQRDIYQGFAYNAQPDQKQMALFVGPAGSLVGTLGGTRVQIIDDNMDGVYGSPLKGWAYVGLVDGAYQNDLDSIVVGEAKFARPWSRLQKVGDAWYELAPNEAGTDVLARRVEVKSGTLQLELKGAPVVWLIVRGMGTERADLCYDVVAGGANKVEVPAGNYEIVSGMVATGKKAQMAKALVVPGRNTRTWRVEAGETVKMELGAPFGFEFEFKQDDETVTVVGPSIAVIGRGGETYQRMWNCVVTPEVLLRKAGSSRGKKEAELVPVGSQEELLDQKNDYKTAWFPIGNPIKKPSPGDPCEVQLFQKKHKLFGKVESDWKAQ